MPDRITKELLEQSTIVRLDQRWEVAYWTREFHLSEEQLRELLARAGDRADNIRRYIECTTRGAAPVRRMGWRPGTGHLSAG
jgi:hypothetical protein